MCSMWFRRSASTHWQVYDWNLTSAAELIGSFTIPKEKGANIIAKEGGEEEKLVENFMVGRVLFHSHICLYLSVF
jgi:hypothetical protein